FVLADIPGLIEGAHEGAGIGDRFLGHVERTGVLIHLVDGTQDDVAGAYKTIRKELKAYSPLLATKPEILCLNKCDGMSPEEIEEKSKALIKAAKLKKGRGKAAPSPILAISGAANMNLTELLRRAFAVIQETRAREADAAGTTIETEVEVTVA
ncbi:MAG: hypothetical protein F9K43_31250, partial [Bauldia sp.]